LSPDQHKKVEQRDEIKRRLGIPVKEKSTISDDPSEWFTYRSIFSNLLDCAKAIVSSLKMGSGTITIKVEQCFNLQELFDSWHDMALKTRLFLFRSLDDMTKKKNKEEELKNIHAWKLLADWKVSYEDTKKSEKALDEGGPTREFFSQVFRQMGDLTVMVGVTDKYREKYGLSVGDSVRFRSEVENKLGLIVKKIVNGNDGGPPETYQILCRDGEDVMYATQENIELRQKPIKLFESTDEGFIPVKNEMIIDNIDRFQQFDNSSEKKKKKRKEDIIERVQVYYRAIGRIMLHCLATNHPISSAAMPRFFQNVLFRKCLPGENGYHRSDIVDHLISIGQPMKLDGVLDVMTIGDLLCDDDDTLITSDSYFTKLLPKYLVHSRSIALDALREGLTLNGLVNIPVQFCALPFGVVSKIAFSNPTISADDVIAFLEPRYNAGGECNDKQLAKEEQEYFFNNILKKLLKEKEEEEHEDKKKQDKDLETGKSFLSRFVSFCTGLNYLPHRIGNPDFSIIVEFNFDPDECAPESLPIAHTCVNTLKIHGLVYNNDKEKFEEKLALAIENTEGCFGMT